MADGLLRIQSPLFRRGQLQNALAALRVALEARDLCAALDRLRSLVSDYTPSATLLALASRSSQRVSP